MDRLGAPPEVYGLGVIWIATGGLVVTGIGLGLLALLVDEVLAAHAVEAGIGGDVHTGAGALLG